MVQIVQRYATSYLQALFILCFAITLPACISSPVIKPQIDLASYTLHQAHLQHIAQIKDFSLQGRIGVQTEGRGFSGGLHWQHRASNDDIALYSPLGSQVASIKKSIEQITLQDANGNSISASDAETLTQSALGWQLPLSGLAHWSLGRPTDSPIQNSTWDDKGLLTTLNQDGWKIEYQNYAMQNGYLLPSKIILKSDKVNLKLLVESWTIIEPDKISPP
jgi:outer membrane lipoprotein LolB